MGDSRMRTSYGSPSHIASVHASKCSFICRPIASKSQSRTISRAIQNLRVLWPGLFIRQRTQEYIKPPNNHERIDNSWNGRKRARQMGGPKHFICRLHYHWISSALRFPPSNTWAFKYLAAVQLLQFISKRPLFRIVHAEWVCAMKCQSFPMKSGVETKNFTSQFNETQTHLCNLCGVYRTLCATFAGWSLRMCAAIHCKCKWCTRISQPKHTNRNNQIQGNVQC